MNENLTNKHILIIGGNSGFGQEIAKQALTSKAAVTITGRDTDKNQQTVLNLSKFGDIDSRIFDAGSNQHIQDFFGKLGQYDHIISMVGGAMGGGFIENDEQTIRTAIEEKFFLNLAIVKAARSHLNQNGSFVLTSGAGRRYDQASGAIVGNQGVNGLVQGTAIELAPNIRINAVAPTWTPTQLWRQMNNEDLQNQIDQQTAANPLKKISDPQEVAKAYLFLMDCQFITGQTITVDGGSTLLR